MRLIAASIAISLTVLPITAIPARAIPVADGRNETALGMPIRGFDQITSPYGWRMHPVLHRPEFHKGVDFAAPAGTPVVASEAGTIELIGWRGNYGHYVRLRHADGLGTGYAHLSRTRPGLHTGSRVGRGEVIGFVGASGLATGPHLFYEVFRDGGWVDLSSVGLPVGDRSGETYASVLANRKRPPARGRPPRLVVQENLLEAAPSATKRSKAIHDVLIPSSWFTNNRPGPTIRYRLVPLRPGEQLLKVAAEADERRFRAWHTAGMQLASQHP